MRSKPRPQVVHRYWPSSLRGGGAVWPARNRALQAPQSVLGPWGPGPLPLISASGALHQPQNQLPPLQKRWWPMRPPWEA